MELRALAPTSLIKPSTADTSRQLIKSSQFEVDEYSLMGNGKQGGVMPEIIK